jgi:hypothetical protein
MNVLKQAAYQYARLGWAVFPLIPGDKRPLPGSNGFKDATKDPEAVEAIWRKYPNANIGLACGAISGVYVVDIDVDLEKGTNGFNTLAERGITLPATVSQRTPRGGRHLFFTSDTEIRNQQGVLPSIDIRGDGGYVVLAPSVRSDGTAYKWDDVLHPWNVRPIPFPDNMPRVRPKPRPGVEPGVRVLGVRDVSLVDEDFRRRVLAYIERIDPAVEGQRGHDCLLWFFQCCINGLCLSKSEAVQLGWEYYNPRCNPPWDAGVPAQYREFNRKADEAESHPTDKFPRGWIRDDPEFNIPTVPCDFDIRAFAESQKAKTAPEPAKEENAEEESREFYGIQFWLKAKKHDEELEFLCQPHGLVGDVAAYINQSAKYPQPFLSVAAALTFLGSVFGRKIRDEGDLRTNLYTLGIGPSSSGKNNALVALRRLAMESGHFDNIGGDEVTSAAAIETHVHANPSTIFLWDEIGHMFKSAKGRDEHKATVIPLLMKLYSLASVMYKGKSYADAEKQRIIVQPCVSFYGTSTMERFTEGVSFEELDDGWIARVLMFRADEAPVYRDSLIIPAPESLVSALRAWKKLAVPEMTNDEGFIAFAGAPAGANGDPIPQPFTFVTEPKAEAEFASLRKFARSYDGLYKTLWLKSEEIARRVALIMAAGRTWEGRTIEWIDAYYAVRLVKYCVNDFVTNVASGVGGDLSFKFLKRTLSVVEAAGVDGIQHSKLRNRCARWRREFDGIVKHLLDTEEIFALKKGRSVYYWHQEHRALYEEAIAKCTPKNS